MSEADNNAREERIVPMVQREPNAMKVLVYFPTFQLEFCVKRSLMAYIQLVFLLVTVVQVGLFLLNKFYFK